MTLDENVSLVDFGHGADFLEVGYRFGLQQLSRLGLPLEGAGDGAARAAGVPAA